MKKRILTLSLLSVMVALGASAFALRTTSAVAAAGPSATGHGTLTLPDGRKRQFSFSAKQRADGTVSGNAVIHNPDFDFRAHLDITCLQVDGNRASMGGRVSANDPALDGLNGFFTVYDNGEPGKNNDTISLVFFDPVSADTCQLIGPDDFDQMPIDGGNIQVRP